MSADPDPPGAVLDDVFGSVQAVRRRSTAEQTADSIRELILEGRLPPGTALTEKRLAVALEVSRPTIREALLMLAGEGIVVQHHHRGAAVTTLSARDIKHLCAARRLLELAAVHNGDLSDLTALSDALDGLDLAAAQDDWTQIPKADVRFHRALVALLANPKLEGFYAQLETELRFATLVTSRWDALHGESLVEEHRGVLELLKVEQRDECAVRLAQILDETEGFLLKSFAIGD